MGSKRSSKKLGKQAAGIRDSVTPQVEVARDKIVEDYLPQAQHAVAEVASSVREAVAEKVSDAASHAQDALPTRLSGKKKSHKGRKLLMVLGITGLAAAVLKKLRGGRDNQPATYSRPQPVPTPASRPDRPARPEPTPMGDSAAQAVASTTDQGGGTPGELLADADEGPRPVTTPEKPAEEIDVSGEPDPKADPQG